MQTAGNKIYQGPDQTHADYVGGKLWQSPISVTKVDMPFLILFSALQWEQGDVCVHLWDYSCGDRG